MSVQKRVHFHTQKLKFTCVSHMKFEVPIFKNNNVETLLFYNGIYLKEIIFYKGEKELNIL
jgi:hypothetical protein